MPSRDKPSARAGDGLELDEHAVDEALDRARRLEPKAEQDRVDARRSRGSAASSESIASVSASCWAWSIGLGSTQFRCAKTSLSSSIDRPSRTCSTGSRSHSETAACPAGVARKIVRFGPRAPGSWPEATIRPRCVEDLEPAVDERALQRPDRAELAGLRQLSSQCPAMRRPLAEQREHGPFTGSKVPIAHRNSLYAASRVIGFRIRLTRGFDIAADARQPVPPGSLDDVTPQWYPGFGMHDA